MDYNTAFQKLTEAKPELGDKDLGACSVLLDAVVDWSSWRALTLCTTPTSIKEYFLSKLRSTGSKRSADETVEVLRLKEELAYLKPLAWSPQAARETVERFKDAVYTVNDAPHSMEALLTLCRERGPIIPVTQSYLDEVMAEPASKHLVLGHGALAEHMSTLLRNLAGTTAGSTESPTTVAVTGQLFKVLYERLDKYLGQDALGATVLQNESVSKASSAVEANKRPDHVILSKRKQTLGVMEDKKAGDMLSAEMDLRDKLLGGLFALAYQGISAILVVAVAGVDIKLGVSDINGAVVVFPSSQPASLPVNEVSLMNNAFSVTSTGGAIWAVVAACTFYGIFLHMQDLSPTEINAAAFGVPIPRPEGATILPSSLKHGVSKTIKDFAGYCTKFGVTLQNLTEAYSVDSPFLSMLKPREAGNPFVTTARGGRQTYHLEMMTYGWDLDVKKLTPEEAARCVYAWLCVASQLHARFIVAADFRWVNVMKQQAQVSSVKAALNPAYQKLTWIPLIIDLELARTADQEPLQTLTDWGPDVLQEGKYTRSSDVYQIGIMLRQWCEASGCTLDDHGLECLDLLLSHSKSAAEIAISSAWLEGARAVFNGISALIPWDGDCKITYDAPHTGYTGRRNPRVAGKPWCSG